MPTTVNTSSLSRAGGTAFSRKQFKQFQRQQQPPLSSAAIINSQQQQPEQQQPIVLFPNTLLEEVENISPESFYFQQQQQTSSRSRLPSSPPNHRLLSTPSPTHLLATPATPQPSTTIMPSWLSLDFPLFGKDLATVRSPPIVSSFQAAAAVTDPAAGSYNNNDNSKHKQLFFTTTTTTTTTTSHHFSQPLSSSSSPSSSSSSSQIIQPHPLVAITPKPPVKLSIPPLQSSSSSGGYFENTFFNNDDDDDEDYGLISLISSSSSSSKITKNTADDGTNHLIAAASSSSYSSAMSPLPPSALPASTPIAPTIIDNNNNNNNNNNNIDEIIGEGFIMGGNYYISNYVQPGITATAATTLSTINIDLIVNDYESRHSLFNNFIINSPITHQFANNTSFGGMMPHPNNGTAADDGPIEIVDWQIVTNQLANGNLSSLILALCLLIFPIVTVFGNLLVVISVYAEKSLRSSTNFYIVSLAFADILVGALVMPLAVYVELAEGVWRLGNLICDIWIACDVMACTASILHLVAISIDRLIAVTKPMLYARNTSYARVWFSIGAAWFVSAIIAMPIILGANNMSSRQDLVCTFYNSDFILASSVGSFYIPSIAIVAPYFVIFRTLQRRAKKLHRMRYSGGEKFSPQAAESSTNNATFHPSDNKNNNNNSAKNQKKKSCARFSPPTTDSSLVIYNNNNNSNKLMMKSRFSIDDHHKAADEQTNNKQVRLLTAVLPSPSPSSSPIFSRRNGKKFSADDGADADGEFSTFTCEGVTSNLFDNNRNELLSPNTGDDAPISSISPISNTNNNNNNNDDDDDTIDHVTSKLLNNCPLSDCSSFLSSGDMNNNNNNNNESNNDYNDVGSDIGLSFQVQQHDKDRPLMIAVVNDHAIGEILIVEDERDGNNKTINYHQKTSSSGRKSLIATTDDGNNKVNEDVFADNNNNNTSNDNNNNKADYRVIASIPVPTGAPNTKCQSNNNNNKANSINSYVTITNTTPTTTTTTTITPATGGGNKIMKISPTRTNSSPNNHNNHHRYKSNKGGSNNSVNYPAPAVKMKRAAMTKERRATVMTVIVLALFFICWIPFFCANTANAICIRFLSGRCVSGHIMSVFVWLGYINSLMNPVVYSVFNPEFRKAFKKVLHLDHL